MLEPDEALTEVVRRELPLPRRHRIRVRPVDGLTGVAALADASADVVVLDAYAGGRVPAELTTVEFLRDVRRVLRAGGWRCSTSPTSRGCGSSPGSSPGPAAAFGQVALIATHEVLKGKRFGNTVVVASASPLDLAALRRKVADMAFPTGLRDDTELRRELGTPAPWTVADSSPSPPPPPLKGWRLR